MRDRKRIDQGIWNIGIWNMIHRHTKGSRSVEGKIEYGPRDAICVLMSRGRKVAYRWTGRARWYTLDGQRAGLRQLEDEAERYERLRDRITER